MQDKGACLEKLEFWNSLSSTEKEVVHNNSYIKVCKKGNLIHGGGDNCLGMISIFDGVIRTYMVSEEGREVTLFRLYEGDCCVLSAACVITQITFDTEMVADEDCSFLVINSDTFEQLTKHNIYVRNFMLELISKRFSLVMWTMQQILFMGYDKRLAAFLIDEYDRKGTKEIRFTHEQIAQNTSSAREVVARMLKRFAQDGLVEYERGKIELIDVDKLRRLINE